MPEGGEVAMRRARESRRSMCQTGSGAALHAFPFRLRPRRRTACVAIRSCTARKQRRRWPSSGRAMVLRSSSSPQYRQGSPISFDTNARSRSLARFAFRSERLASSTIVAAISVLLRFFSPQNDQLAMSFVVPARGFSRRFFGFHLLHDVEHVSIDTWT